MSVSGSRVRVGSLACLIGLTSSVALAGTIRHDPSVTDSDYTTLGNNAAFASSGLLTVGGDVRGGVLIRNNLTDTTSRYVVTAGHNASSPADMKFSVGGTSYDVEAVFVHPSFAGAGRPNDIAILRLTASVPNVTPANVYKGSSELTSTATMVGFGTTGTGLTGSQAGTQGTKRGGRNIIDAFGIHQGGTSLGLSMEDGSDRTLLATDFDSPTTAAESSMGSSTPLSLEYQIADKDSGSGMFATIGGTQYLVGVNVLITADSPPASYGSLSLATRLSSYQSFIGSIVPEPSGLLLGSIGVFGLLSRRRR